MTGDVRGGWDTGGNAGNVGAVIFDWGGTITPWHTVDIDEQWRVFAREYHPEAEPGLADELATRIWEAESAGWSRGRDEGASARLEDILAEAGIVADDPRAVAGLAAYQAFWSPTPGPTLRSDLSGKGCTTTRSGSASCRTRSGPVSTTAACSRVTASSISSTPTSTPARRPG